MMRVGELNDVAWAHFWQVSVVILAVGLLTKFCCRCRPHLAYILWLVVLVKCVTPPLWASPIGIFSWQDAETFNLRRDTIASPPATTNVPQEFTSDHDSPDPETRLVETVVNPVADASVTSDSHSDQRRSYAAPAWNSNSSLQPVLAIVWLAGATIHACLVMWGATRFWFRIRKTACNVEPLGQVLAELSRRLSLHRPVRLAVVRESVGPLAYGILHPTVVIPKALADARSPRELEPILAHELVHIRRGDVVVGLLQVIVQSLWWFHPLVWWANRQIVQERERCCDEEVIAGLAYRSGDYARSLLDVLEWKTQCRLVSVLPGIRPFEVTKHRLEYLMKNSMRFHKRTPRWQWLVLLLSLCVLVPGAQVANSDESQQESEKQATEHKAEPASSGINKLKKVSKLVSPNGKKVAYGQIAVGANGEQQVRIIIGDVDGENRQALPINGESVDEVQWFGDDQVAYVTEHGHGHDGYHLMDLRGKPAGHLTMPPGCDSFFHQCLSPDGNWIAFCGNYSTLPDTIDSPESRKRYLKEHPEVKVQHGLFAVNLKNKVVKHLLNETVANLPAWSADSKYIACGIGHYVKNYPLAVVDVATGEVKKPEMKGVGVSWSPDGSMLAMTTDVIRGGSWRGGVPLDGAMGVWELVASRRTIVSPAALNSSTKEPYSWKYRGSHSPVWSADGKWIAYIQTEYAKSANRDDQKREEVWIVGRDGGAPRKVLNHGASELAWAPDGRTLLWVAEGRFGRVDRDVDTVSLGPTQAVPTGSFTIRGRVTDGEGRALDGVSIRVARGMGTLHSTSPVLSDRDGQYEVRFDPAMHSRGANAQFACVFASKPGFYEKELCRAGNLGMANFKAAGFDQKELGVVGMVFPNNPYQLDFTMLPAARVSLVLVNRAGAPLANYEVQLNGSDLYPASSVLAVQKTNEQGRVELDNVPLKQYAFAIGSGRAKYQTDLIPFDRPGQWKFRVVYDDINGTLTAMLE